MEIVSSVLDLPAYLARRDIQKLIIIGGVARSGTTFVGNMLHSHPSIFCFEECMLLKQKRRMEFFDFQAQISCLERNNARPHGNLNWRGIMSEDDHKRLLFQFTSLLAAGTGEKALLGKDLPSVNSVACKTPSAEFTVPDVARFVSPLPVFYVHSVRHPRDVVKSNWKMPWIKIMDPAKFLVAMERHFHLSLKAFRAIAASDTPCVALKVELFRGSETRQSAIANISTFLRVEQASTKPSIANVDHWPIDLRRDVEDIPNTLLQSFMQRRDIQEWCTEFGYEV